MDCLVFEGLGNRINGMASALVATGGKVDLYWSVNKHCPLPYESIFKPISRLVVRKVRAKRFRYHVSTNSICHYYPVNPARIQRRFGCRFRDAYALILSRMIPKAEIDFRPTVGLHYRRHMPESAPLDEYIEYARQWMEKRAGEVVFVSSDCSESAAAICAAFPDAHTIEQSGLTHDFDRSADNMIAWCRALSVFKKCRRGVLSSTFRSSALDSIRGYEIPIDYVESGQRARDLVLENQITNYKGRR